MNARRTTMAAAVALASTLATGCSLFNAPDTDFLDTPPPIPDFGPPDVADMMVPDEGIEADVPDMDVPDGGPDMADMFMPPPVEDCANTSDDDRDGFTDCADEDCYANLVACCGPDPRVARSYDLRTDGVIIDDWVATPGTATVDPPGGAVRAVNGGALVLRPETGTLPQCVPMDSGLKMVVELDMRTGVAPEGRSMGVTLTRARQAGTDELPAELRIAMHDGRRLVVSQAGIERQAADVPMTVERVTVTVTLTPAATPIGTAGLAVEVEASMLTLSAPTEPLYIEHLVTSETDGMDSHLCTLDSTSGSGLYVALEGGSTDAEVGLLSLAPSQCLSPSRWSRDSDLRTSATLIATASAIGDVGFTVADPSAGQSWYVMADITNGDPDAEDILFVPWALSLLYSRTGTNFERLRDMGVAVNEPTIGSLCLPGLCSDHSSVREAEMVPTTDGFLLFAAACERPGEYGLYDVCFARQPADDRGRTDLRTFALALPTTPLGSYRAPAIASIGNAMVVGAMHTYTVRLFAIQHDDDGRQSVVTAVVEVVDADGDGTLDPVVTTGPVPLFSADSLGSIARKGIRSLTVLPEPAAGDGTLAYRMWLVTEAPGEATVSHAIITFPTTGGDPEVRLYAANPVLRPGAGALSECDDTDDERCKIRGVSVTADATRLYMLVSYDEPGNVAEPSRLVTLFQPLRGSAE